MFLKLFLFLDFLMNIPFDVRITTGHPPFYHFGQTWASGTAWIGETQLNAENIAELFDSLSSLESIRTAVNQLVGFYSIISIRENCAILIVDPIRSIPLFYADEIGNIFISNSSNSIFDALTNPEKNREAQTEFLLTGYTTGQDTLIDLIHQVRPGEIVTISKRFDGFNICSEFYFNSIFRSPGIATTNELHAEFDSILKSIFSRLCRLADGRQIVLPLSGGLDSRLIALWLKELNYTNVLTFTYGKTEEFAEVKINK